MARCAVAVDKHHASLEGSDAGRLDARGVACWALSAARRRGARCVPRQALRRRCGSARAPRPRALAPPLHPARPARSPGRRAPSRRRRGARHEPRVIAHVGDVITGTPHARYSANLTGADTSLMTVPFRRRNAASATASCCPTSVCGTVLTRYAFGSRSTSAWRHTSRLVRAPAGTPRAAVPAPSDRRRPSRRCIATGLPRHCTRRRTDPIPRRPGAAPHVRAA